MTRRTVFPVLCACAVVLAAAAIVAHAGPIDPPAGPVTSTFKTLTEVEPRIAINAANTPGTATALFRITQPGSYYLTGNITGVSGKRGIEIAASGVTLDLMGFDLVGVAGSLDGVNVSVTATNVAVVNGSVRDWAGDGVNLTNATNTRLADLRVSGNAGIGIVTSDNAVVTGCSARFNTGNGINAAAGCMITGCSVESNTGNGISTADGCTISNCTATLNTLDGIVVTTGCLVLANACATNGYLAGDGAGIHATGFGNRIEGNNCIGCDRGIGVASAHNIIIKNTCSGNTTDWVIADNNVFGPILDRRAPASAAVSGFSAASTLGSTDPNANFSY